MGPVGPAFYCAAEKPDFSWRGRFRVGAWAMSITREEKCIGMRINVVCKWRLVKIIKRGRLR